MKKLQDGVDTKPVEFPRLHLIDKIAFILFPPLILAYLLNRWLFKRGVKRDFSHTHSSKSYKFGGSSGTAYDPYSYRPGTTTWNFTHRK